MPDQTAEVQGIIDGTPNGGSIDFEGRKYQVDGTLRYHGRKGIRTANLIAAAANVYDVTRTDFTVAERGRSQVSVDKASEDLTFINVAVEGSNRNWISSYDVPGNGLEGQAGFAVGLAKRIEFDRCSAEWTFGDAFSVQGGTIKDVGHPPSEDIWVHHSKLRHIGRIGFLSNNALRARFNRNDLDTIRRPWAHGEPNFLDSIVQSIYIEDNILRSGVKLAAYWTGGKPTDVPVNNIIVRRNQGIGVGISGNFGLPVGTSTIPFPRRERFYWVDNVSDLDVSQVSVVEANYIMVRGVKNLEVRRCCGVNVDQADILTACNLSGTFPAPTTVPEMPAAWPYPIDSEEEDMPVDPNDPVIVSINTQLVNTNGRISTSDLARAMQVQRIDNELNLIRQRHTELIAAVAAGDDLDVAEAMAYVDAEVEELRQKVKNAIEAGDTANDVL